MIYQKGNYYHIFNRGCNKESIFFQESDYNMLISKMFQTKDTNKIEIIAYCLMPNHYHLLIYQLSEKPISDWLKSLFSGYVQRINRKYNRSGTLFERSAQPKLISKDNYLIELTHYIHANPIRHGFVRDPLEWKSSSLSPYFYNTGSEQVSARIINDHFSDEFNYQEAFKEYLENKKYESNFNGQS